MSHNPFQNAKNPLLALHKKAIHYNSQAPVKNSNSKWFRKLNGKWVAEAFVLKANIALTLFVFLHDEFENP